MPTLPSLAEIVVRAAKLVALAAAPPLFSPEPVPSERPLAEGAIALVLFAAIVLAATRLRGRLSRRDALVGGGSVVLALVVAFVCAARFRGAAGPLGRGLFWTAVPLWIGLAVTAGAVAAARFGERFGPARLVASLLVLAGGAALFGSQLGWIASPRQMWWQALRKDGRNGAAAAAIAEGPLRARDYAAAIEVLDRCLVASPGSCACLARRADVAIRFGAGARALDDATAAVAACPDDPASLVAEVAARAYLGDGAGAESRARAALAKRDLPVHHYALALALDREGRAAEATDEARRAVEGGAGRDASLLLAALSIRAGDLDAAERWLAPIVAAEPKDAEARYDLALVAHRRGRYNDAREGYLAALAADPRMADARFNLVDLTLRHQVVDEARHHARKFAEAFPDDPRNETLQRMIAAASGSAR